MIKSVDWILPMCGDGTRTQSRGAFKPLINVNDKPIFEHFLSQLKFHFNISDKLILTIRRDHNQLFNAKNKLIDIVKKYIPQIELQVITINTRTRGPVETIEKSFNSVRDDSIVAVVNPDQIVDFKWPISFDTNAIYIALGFDNSGKSSYVSLNSSGEIKRIKEKDLISYYASVGVYIFGSKELIKSGLEKTSIHKEFNHNNEQYLSHLIQLLIEDEIPCYPLETTLKFDLGNISCINYFESDIGERRAGTLFK